MVLKYINNSEVNEKKIDTKEDALNIFVESALNIEIATTDGDYKMANKNYKINNDVISYLKKIDEIESLISYLTHTNMEVRLLVAIHLLPINERLTKSVLERISKEKRIVAHDAEMTLSEWKKGNLDSL